MDAELRCGAFLAPALCALAMLFPQTGEGQTVEGRVSDAANQRPIAGVMLWLVDSEGVDRASTVADTLGRYRLEAPTPGSYGVRAEWVGYEPFRSAPLDVEGNRTRFLDVAMRPAPVPVRGIEVSADRLDRRVREFTGLSTGRLRIPPVRLETIREHANRGNGLGAMIATLQIPGLEVLRTPNGPCYQFRGRGCVPVYLDGARLTRSSPLGLPLDMVGAVVILRPSEAVAYPAGAVHVFTIGYLR